MEFRGNTSLSLSHSSMEEDSKRGTTRNSYKIHKGIANLLLMVGKPFQMERSLALDKAQFKNSVELVSQREKREIQVESCDAADHQASDPVEDILEDLHVKKTDQEDVGNAELPEFPLTAEVEKSSCSFSQVQPSSDTDNDRQQEKSGRLSDGSLKRRQNNRCHLATKQRRGRPDLKTSASYASGRNLIVYFLMLNLTILCAVASATTCETNQNFPANCSFKIRPLDHCPREPAVQKQLNELCCAAYQQHATYHCQEKVNCLIHACVPEVVVAPGKTAELRTDIHGTPNHTIVDCEDGYYESLPRSSRAIIFPNCQLEKTSCTKDGELLLEDGGMTTDNLCDCQQEYRYVGGTFTECRRGFGLDSLCACEPCATGKKRDDNNICIEAGSASKFTQRATTRPTPSIRATEPTRSTTSTEKELEDSVSTFTMIPEVLIIAYTVIGVGLYFPIYYFKETRNILRLSNGFGMTVTRRP